MAERRYTRRQKRALAQNRTESPAANPAQPSGRRQKATGWKVPLIFCAVILLMAGAGWLYRKVTAPPPLPINAELLEYAAKTHFDLDADEEGRKFKEELISASRGFSPAYAKDEKLAAVAGQAIDAGRMDVLVTAIGVIRDGDRRTKLLKLLASNSMKRCEDLPWAVFAARNLTHEYATAMELTRTLNARYEECKREMPSGWPKTVIPTAPVGEDRDKGQAAPQKDTAQDAAPAGNTPGTPTQAPQEAAQNAVPEDPGTAQTPQ